MKTNPILVERPKDALEFPNNGLLGVGAGVVGLISGLALWYLGTGNYEIFGQGFTFVNSHLLAFHVGRYSGFAEYQGRFMSRFKITKDEA